MAPQCLLNEAQIPQHSMWDLSWSSTHTCLELYIQLLEPCTVSNTPPGPLRMGLLHKLGLLPRRHSHPTKSPFTLLTPIALQVLALTWISRLEGSLPCPLWTSGNGPIWVLGQCTWVNTVFCSPGPSPVVAGMTVTNEWALRRAAISGERVRVIALLPKDFLSNRSLEGSSLLSVRRAAYPPHPQPLELPKSSCVCLFLHHTQCEGAPIFSELFCTLNIPCSFSSVPSLLFPKTNKLEIFLHLKQHQQKSPSIRTGSPRGYHLLFSFFTGKLIDKSTLFLLGILI